MASVGYSARSLAHFERDFQFLRDDNPHAAVDAVAAMQTAADALAAHPLLGRPVQGDIRDLVISYGRTGYVAPYRIVFGPDEVRILAIRRQRESGFAP